MAGLFFSAMVAGAAEPLPAILDAALTDNPEIMGLEQELQAAGYNLEAARWGRFPNVFSDGRAVEGNDEQLQIGVEQPLWSGGRISGEINAAEASESVSLLRLQETEQQILLQTTEAFFDILRLERLLAIAVENENEHQRLLEGIQRRVRSEVSADTDARLAETRLRQAVNERIQIERGLATAKRRLESLINRPAPALIGPQGVDTGNWTLDQAQAMARAHSPTRARLLSEIDLAAAEVQISRAQTRPSVVLGYQSIVGDLTAGQERSNAYLALRAELGSGLSRLAGQNAAIARREAALIAIQAHERELKLQVQSLWSEIDALDRQLPGALSALEGAQAISDSYLRQFQVGRTSWLDVLNAQREKTLAQNAVADIEVPLASARAQLLIIMGEYNQQRLAAN